MLTVATFLAERVGDGQQLAGGLAVPQAVLDAVQAGEALVADAARQAVRQPVDREAEVAEAVVGRADPLPVELGGQPVLLGLRDVAVPQVGLDGRGDVAARSVSWAAA